MRDILWIFARSHPPPARLDKRDGRNKVGQEGDRLIQKRFQIEIELFGEDFQDILVPVHPVVHDRYFRVPILGLLDQPVQRIGVAFEDLRVLCQSPGVFSQDVGVLHQNLRVPRQGFGVLSQRCGVLRQGVRYGIQCGFDGLESVV